MANESLNGADLEQTSSLKGMRLHWMRARENIDMRWADSSLMVCSFVCGLIDSVAFNAVSVFVSMQTGNTIFIALGSASLPVSQPTVWARAIVSVAAFWVGCWFFATGLRQLGPRNKLTLFASFFIQAALIFVSAAMAQTDVAPAFGYKNLDPLVPFDEEQKLREEAHYSSYIVIALLAFQSSGQITLSRSLGFNEVPTVVVTSLYCDLFSDPKLLDMPLRSNVKRNRRVLAVILLVAGGILGGWLQRTSAGMPGALWLAAGLKLAMAISWLGWRSETVSGYV
ncbi:Protein of unknown function (DUF1275) [Geosmithia morbida]|uniref:DUF1275 domain protein n=1 Tax=Geosmithia morbida TaxID=1094350 RepID=A0A9P5D0I1_9HYPO|nr:Protein of unknown function (DUF1275) [Geosmithia morbida]KAF4119476.1 Protein of unknown function (DUF1275) [Geosmithia morbida]